MITPRFSCTQTDQSVVVSTYCPAVRASDVEIHVEDTLFTLVVNPYFLRLNFDKHVLEDDASSAYYDPASGYLTVTLTKEIPGEVFEGLDLLAKLLAPRLSVTGTPGIEVLGEQQSTELDAYDVENELVASTEKLSMGDPEIIEAAQNDWQLPQTVPEPLPSLRLSSQQHYGFLDLHSGFFTHVSHTANEVNELGPDAETLSPNERTRRRIQHEDAKWDEEHYMADYADDSYIQEILLWKHPHTVVPSTEFKFTEEENLMFLRLPRTEYLSTPAQTHNLYLTLITLLFSYCYETRTTQHEPTPESAWTISTLTPAFSALDPPISSTAFSTPGFTPSELATAVIPSYRRSMAFPLYRSFALAEACRADVAEIMLKGKRVVARCLLEMKHILDHHEVYYVYSKIWVDDFCSWIQACASDDILHEMGGTLRDLKVEKDSIGWGLEELEAAARDAVYGESDSDDES